jgi:hypothetical protein
MARQDLTELGFREGTGSSPEQSEPQTASENEEKRRRGFVAGLRQ